MLTFNLNSNRGSSGSAVTSNDTTGLVSPIGSLSNPFGLASTLLQPSGFDNLVDSLGLGSLFGQTSFETFAQAGGVLLEQFLTTFSQNVNTDPSAAFTQLSFSINKEIALYDLKIDNASSNRTIKGLPISQETLKGGLKLLSEYEGNLSSSFDIVKTSKTDSVYFKKSKNFSYNVYKLEPKKQTFFSSSSGDALSSLNGDNSDGGFTRNLSNNKVIMLLLIVPIAIFGIYKLYKKYKK